MMRSRNRFLLLGVLAFSFFFAPLAEAVRVENNLSRSSTGVEVRPPLRNGTVNSIDLGLNTIVIDGVTYLYSSASVIVRSSDALSKRDALALAKGDRIQFLTQVEPGSRLEKVIEIWFLRGKGSPKTTK